MYINPLTQPKLHSRILPLVDIGKKTNLKYMAATFAIVNNHPTRHRIKKRKACPCL